MWLTARTVRERRRNRGIKEFSKLLSWRLRKKRNPKNCPPRQKSSLALSSSFAMSPSTAAATAAAALLLRRRSSSSSIGHRCCTSLIARDGGATASASGRSTVVVGRSFSSRLLQQPLSALAALGSATSQLQRLSLVTPKSCPRGFAGSSPFSSSNVVEASSSSPSPPSSSKPSPSFVRLNNIFPSPGSKSQVSFC